MTTSKATYRSGRDIDALAENMEIATGQRGSGLDRMITVRDLNKLGLAEINRQQTGKVSVKPRPETPVKPGPLPHAPVNVFASGAYTVILLEWGAPTYQGHAHAEIWRAAEDNLSKAVRIATTAANVYPDPVGTHFGAYYWVRFVNANDRAGPYQSTAGVYAETSRDVGDIIEDLEGKLNESHLTTELREKIDDAASQEQLNAARQELAAADEVLDARIDTTQQQLDESRTELSGAVDSVRVRLDVTAESIIETALGLDREQVDRRAREAVITQRQDTLVNDQQSLARDVVRIEANFDEQQAQVTEVQQTVATEKEATAQALQQLGSRVDSDRAAVEGKITELQQTVATEDLVLSERISGLDASFSGELGKTNANLTELEQSVADEDEALSRRIDSVATKSEDNAAAILSERQARINADSAVAKDLLDLSAAMDTADNALRGDITELNQVVIDKTEALAQRADSLGVSVDGSAEAAIINSLNQDDRQLTDRKAFARITNEQKVTASEVESQAVVLQRVESGIGEARAEIDDLKMSTSQADEALSQRLSQTETSVGNNTAAIATEQTARSNADSALGQRIDNVSAKTDQAAADITGLQKTVADGDSALSQQIAGLNTRVGNNESSLTAEQTARSNADTALGQRIDTVKTSLDGTAATVQTNSQAIAKINSDGSTAYQAMWNAKAQVGDIQTGIGIIAGKDSAGNQVSQVAINAAQVFVFNGNAAKPGETVTPMFAIDDGQAVMPEALIRKATIQILQSETIVADSVKAGIEIVSPFIKTARIESGGFTVDELGNATFGQLVSISATGQITIRSALTGRRMIWTNGLIQIFDDDNFKIADFGIW